jgi:hypothetical protein
MVGYLDPSAATTVAKPAVRWLDVNRLAQFTTTIDAADKSLVVQAIIHDPEGGRWQLRHVFRALASGAIGLDSECSVDTPRSIVFLPHALILPGHGSFGAFKGQGLFAGVEYLENEPSSSTADLNEPGARRKVPGSSKITFPLMAVQAHGNYVGLIWKRSTELCAVFDSPDRTFGSESHALGLLSPGADGKHRVEGELFPFEALELMPERPVKATAIIVGGKGKSVVPAVEQYVALKGLPTLPHTPDLQDYLKLTASGWLDSPIRTGNRFRHAAGGSFGTQPAADAAWMMDWLATLSTDARLARRLRLAAGEASAAVPVEQLFNAAVAHNRYLVAPLVLEPTSSPGSEGTAPSPVIVSLDQAREFSRALAREFEPDGSIRYRAPAWGTDYGRTHFSDEASGMTAERVFRMLEAAVYAGDRDMVDEGLRLVRVLEKRFSGGVPRGAQTWEIPLHTPDILASAYLVRAFALGYELTGEPLLLSAARYWAWTGVPFVYATNPNSEPSAVGPYATIPVLGATNWTAPNWIGLPVQWCGLVYAQALFDLSRLDPDGPWRTVAQGIAASGLAQTYPIEHPHHGLLPDSFTLGTQSRNPPDINPGTLQPLALHLLAGERSVPYSFHALRQRGLWLHAPGAVDEIQDHADSARFTVHPWSPRPSFVIVHGVSGKERGDQTPPKVRVGGHQISLEPPHRFMPNRGTLIIQLEGAKTATVEIGK